MKCTIDHRGIKVRSQSQRRYVAIRTAYKSGGEETAYVLRRSDTLSKLTHEYRGRVDIGIYDTTTGKEV